MKLTPAASTRTSTSPAAGRGVATSTHSMVSGPPGRATRMAFMGRSPACRAAGWQAGRSAAAHHLEKTVSVLFDASRPHPEDVEKLGMRLRYAQRKLDEGAI